MNVESVLLWIGGAAEMPKGDAGKARQAAEAWRRLADRIEESIRITGPVAAEVWEVNTGAGIAAFREFWPTRLEPYPRELAEHCRRVAVACDGYAHAIDVTRFALTLIAVQTWLNVLFTFAWGWITGWAGTLAQLTVIRDRAALQAAASRTLFERIVIRLLEWVYDSVGYAAGQQVLQLGVFGVADLFGDYDEDVKAIIGYDPYSVGANAEQTAQGFGANMAFDAAADGVKFGLTGLGPWGRFLTAGAASGWRPRLVGFGGRMAGSNTYTIVNNAEAGKPVDEWLPTAQQEVQKLIMHGGRIAKNPAKGAVGDRTFAP